MHLARRIRGETLRNEYHDLMANWDPRYKKWFTNWVWIKILKIKIIINKL
jgi:hypothetical protein